MIGTLRFLYLLALVVWIGEIVFFSFVVAPTLFAVLDPARAGAVTSAIFPRYYGLAMVTGAVAVAAALVLGRRAAAPGWWRVALVALSLALGATLWAGLVTQPRVQRLRAAAQAVGQPPSERAEFRAAHREAVGLNGAALLAGLAGLAASAAALRS